MASGTVLGVNLPGLLRQEIKNNEGLSICFKSVIK